MGRLITITTIILLSLYSLQGHTDDQDRVLELRLAGEVMPLEQILKISRQYQQGSILEVELEQEWNTIIYELKILADDGQVWELKVDAKSGAIIERERD